MTGCRCFASLRTFGSSHRPNLATRSVVDCGITRQHDHLRTGLTHALLVEWAWLREQEWVYRRRYEARVASRSYEEYRCESEADRQLSRLQTARRRRHPIAVALVVALCWTLLAVSYWMSQATDLRVELATLFAGLSVVPYALRCLGCWRKFSLPRRFSVVVPKPPAIRSFALAVGIVSVLSLVSTLALADSRSARSGAAGIAFFATGHTLVNDQGTYHVESQDLGKAAVLSAASASDGALAITVGGVACVLGVEARRRRQLTVAGRTVIEGDGQRRLERRRQQSRSYTPRTLTQVSRQPLTVASEHRATQRASWTRGSSTCPRWSSPSRSCSRFPSDASQLPMGMRPLHAYNRLHSHVVA